MQRVIAVEDILTPVKDFLQAQGCEVIDVKEAKNTQVDAVVLSGGDMNLMGMQDMVIDAPVIDARGKSPREVWDNILKY